MTPKLCKTCGRESRGIGATTWDDHIRIDSYYCSIKCREFKAMTDWTIRERTAIMRGGRMMGEYLESINQFSLDKLTLEQWETALCCFTKEYHLALADQDIIHSAELYS